MNIARATAYLKQRGQSQLLDYFDELTEAQQLMLLSDIENTNFNIIKNIGP